MAAPGEIFLKALEDFKLELNERQTTKFRATTIKHVQAQVIIIQRDQERTKTMMNFNRLKSFISAFEQFDEICKALDLGIPDLSGYIWGPTRSVLDVAKESNDALDSILESYSDFGQHLPLVAEYKSQLRQQPDMTVCLALMYQDLLRFNKSLLKLFETRSWKKTFTANWKDNDPNFESLHRSFDIHGKFLKRALEDQHHRIANETHQRLTDYITRYQTDREELLSYAREQELARKQTQYLDIIRWLRSPGSNEPEKQYQSEFLNIRSEYPSTGTWFLKEDLVQNWMEEDIPEHSILWVHGKKGAGKTILASLLIDHLINQRHESKTSFFYCRERDESLGEPRFLAIMKSLLRQMVCHNRDLLPTMYQRRMREQDILADERTAEVLLDLFGHVNMNQFIVIDGLDELNDRCRERVVQTLDSMVKEANEYSPGKIRVLILSTYLPFLGKLLGTNERIGDYPINSDKTAKDIEVYVAKQSKVLGDTYHLNRSDLELAKSKICANSKGMFLYAFLVMDNLLRQPNASYVRSELEDQSFPDDLDGAYDRIVKRLRNRLHRNTWKEAQKIFGWLSYAKRPLKLYELEAALAISVDDRGRIRIQDSQAQLRMEVQDICGSLVHIWKGHSIEFVHETAKIFIMKKENLDKRTLECDLALLCLSYLSHPSFSKSLQSQQRTALVEKGHYAFQDYAVSKWFPHLEAMIEHSVELFDNTPQGLEYTSKVAMALKSFYQMYQQGLEAINADTHQSQQQTQQAQQQAAEAVEEARKKCEPFKNQGFYPNLLQIWTHVVRHHKQLFKDWDQVSIKELREVLTLNRNHLEELAPDLKGESSRADFIRGFYGDNLFKCNRITCAYFYEGLESKDALENHSNRHERPFQCKVEGCAFASFGFSSNKDRDKHNRMYHPDQSDHPSGFAQLGRRAVADAKFACEECSRSFTRRANLVAHVNSSHLGRRPFSCSTCGKEFTRNNDRRRHEKIHVRRRR